MRPYVVAAITAGFLVLTTGSFWSYGELRVMDETFGLAPGSICKCAAVSAVPAAMTRAAMMPSGSIFCDKANTKTRMAPEQGLIPAAKTAMPISRIEALSSAIGA